MRRDEPEVTERIAILGLGTGLGSILAGMGALLWLSRDVPMESIVGAAYGILVLYGVAVCHAGSLLALLLTLVGRQPQRGWWTRVLWGYWVLVVLSSSMYFAA